MRVFLFLLIFLSENFSFGFTTLSRLIFTGALTLSWRRVVQARLFNYGHGDILSENRKYLLDGSTPVDSTLSSFSPSTLVSFTE